MITAHISSSRTLLGAEEILIVEANYTIAQINLNNIRKMEALYNLQLNNLKLEVLPKYEYLEIFADNKLPIKRKTNIYYIRALLSTDSRPQAKLDRRILE